MLALLSIVPAEAADKAPSGAELEAAWASVAPALTEHGRVPVPSLTSDQWAEVSAGKVVRWRQEVVGAVDGAVGVGWLPHANEHIWVGALDDVHNHLTEGLTEVWLEGTEPGHKVLYQHYDVPAPFADRHWVVVVEHNPDVFEATDGAVWERAWTLDERGPSALEDVPSGTVPDPDEALWTPVNQGGWTLVPAGEGSIVVYQVRSDIAGNIPEELVVRFALSSLDQMVGYLSELAGGVPDHYVGDHFSITRPDLQPLPTYPVSASSP